MRKLYLWAAVIEDDDGAHHQFNSVVSENDLDGKISGWVTSHWFDELGEMPDDGEDRINTYFEKQPVLSGPGFQHELWRLEPIEIPIPDEFTVHYGQSCITYPMEIFVNGGLEFKLDTEDAEGDMRAIKALMTYRCAKRTNRPLTDMELHGTNLPVGAHVHRAPHGKLRVTPKERSEVKVWELPANEIKVTLEARASFPDGCSELPTTHTPP